MFKVLSELKYKGPLLIAEVAQSHDGSLGMAHAFVNAAADAGAHAIKFQTHIAASESTQQEQWRVKFSRQDSSRFDYWKRMEFSPEQWAGLAKHAQERGLIFLSSPFSVEAVRLLDGLDMPIWKIASGEVFNPEVLEAVWATGKPLLFSTGLCTLREIDDLVNQTKERGIECGVFQCTSEYPCKPENWGLSAIPFFKDRYKVPVGLSDHSGKIYSGLAAAALGADMLEIHVAFHRKMFGPDVPASLTFEEFAQLAEGTQSIRTSIECGFDKDQNASEMSRMRNLFGRSWALKEDQPKGTRLSRGMLTLKKPATGFQVHELEMILGKVLKTDKSHLDLIQATDLNET